MRFVCRLQPAFIYLHTFIKVTTLYPLHAPNLIIQLLEVMCIIYHEKRDWPTKIYYIVVDYTHANVVTNFPTRIKVAIN